MVRISKSTLHRIAVQARSAPGYIGVASKAKRAATGGAAPMELLPDLLLWMPGKAVPKARPRVRRDGRTYTPARTREWEDRVALAACCGCRTFRSGVSVELLFQRPARGDIDNLAKAVLDGLVKGGAIADDANVKRLLVTITQEPPEGVRVLIRALP